MSDCGREDVASVTSARNTAVGDPHDDELFSSWVDGVWSEGDGDVLVPSADAGGQCLKSGAWIAISCTGVADSLDDLDAISTMKPSGQISGNILFEWS